MLQQNKGWGEKNVIVMYTCKDNLTPLLYSGKIKKIIKKKKNISKMKKLRSHSQLKEQENSPEGANNEKTSAV